MAIPIRGRDGDLYYFGCSKAIVVDNKDPLQKGRIRVHSPVFGESSFINYLVPTDGFFGPPDIGSVVYIEAGGGDKDYPLATQTVNEGIDTNSDTPAIFRREVPTNRGWVSPGTLNEEGIPIAHAKGHSVELDDGLATVDGTGKITHTTTNKGIRLTTSDNNYIKLQDDKNNIELDATTIKVGMNAVEPMVLGDQWMNYMNTEIVPKINALIASVADLVSDFSSHTHTYRKPDSGADGTATGVSSSTGSDASGALPSLSIEASSAQLAVKGKVE